jgi:hypothetical protein
MYSSTRLRQLLGVCLLAVAGLAASATDAFATHFRYGTIKWTVVNPSTPNVVTIRFESAWRQSYPWSPWSPTLVGEEVTTSVANLGQIIVRNSSGGTVATLTPTLTVTALNFAQDWFAATYETTITLPATTSTYTATFTGCCRITTLRDLNSDRDFIVQAGITVKMPPNAVNQPPTSATVPIITLATGRAASVQLPGSDPNGDAVTFRLASSVESGLFNLQPQSPLPGSTGAFQLSGSGLVTWTPSVNGLYAVQVRLSDPLGAFTVIDLLFNVITATGQLPMVSINGTAGPKTFSVVHGTPVSFTVKGTDPENTPVALTSSALPVGSNMSPSLPMTAVNATSTFDWTPAPSAVGNYVMSFAALDGAGLQATNSVTLIVTNTLPTINCTTNGALIEASSASGGSFQLTADVGDLDDDTLTIRFFVDGIQRRVSGLLTPPATDTHSATFGFGNHTYEARVTDGPGTRSCTGTFKVQDTTAPSILVDPGDQTLAATAADGAVASFVVTAHDAVDAEPEIVCSHSSGGTFPIAMTTVTCTATDALGNHNEASFTINVIDAHAPVIEAHGDVTAEATSASGAMVGYLAPPTQDAIDGAGTSTCVPAPGSSFNLGVTPVTCSAADAFGNHAVDTTFNVIVLDTTAPTIDARGNETAEATGPGGAAVAYAAPATHDAVDGDGLATCSPISGSTFAIGENAVTCSATDAHNNAAANTTFNVFIVDTKPPVIAAHADETAEATSSSGAEVSYASPATDDIVDGDGSASCTPASGSTFPRGESTVTCSATDAHGNHAANTTFKVLVVDTTAPTIDAPADVTVEAVDANGANVSYAAPASHDAVDGDGLASCSPVSGSLFPPGTSTVTCSATDAAGNHAADTTFSVTVRDTTAPTIDAHGDESGEATGPTGALVMYGAPATHDAVSGTGVASCNPASGSTFALGTTTVTCSAADAAGNHATDTTFSVTVVDTKAPTIDAHAAVTVLATSAAGAEVNYDLPATHDAVDGDRVATCAPAPGSTFAIGATTVTCSAIDAHGNHAVDISFTVTVTNNTPTFTPPADISVPATSGLGATVSFAAEGSDVEDGAIAAACTPAAGSTFPLGTTTVQCTVTDLAGAKATGSFEVTVTNNAPTFTPPAHVVVEATGAAGAVVTFSANGSDIEQGAIQAACVPASGSPFAIGTTTVDCTVTDVGAASVSGSFTVTVRDTTAPSIATVTPSARSLWPPNHKLAPIAISVAAADLVTSAPMCTITGVTSNEPQNGLGDGDTPNDWLITGPLTLQVRAERAGNATGRIYTITIRCTDLAGNASTATTTVSVPKS